MNKKKNWLKSIIRQAAKSADIQNLNIWNQSFDAINIENNDFNQLRFILGDILTSLNTISEVYKEGIRTPNPQVSQAAGMLLPDLQNINSLQKAADDTLGIMTPLSQSQPNAQFNILVNMLYSIKNMIVTPEQYQQFAQISQGSSTRQGLPEEMNIKRASDFLKQSIYSADSPIDLSLKVIREVLQNAADAAMKVSQTDPTHRPSIEIHTKSYRADQDTSYMDLMIVDNGVGMDWSTLSQKFFVYFETGKEADFASTGGFGIAKAVIQETPEHGWSIDSNGIHASRFTKNIYMGTEDQGSYQVPVSHAPARRGTTLNLYNIPEVGSYYITDIARKFTSEDLSVVVNGTPVEPLFRAADLKELGGDMSAIVESMAETDTEKEVAQRVVEKQQEGRMQSTGDISYPNETSIKFFVQPKKNGATGHLYVMLNGQFQFNTGWISGVDLICFVSSRSRPIDEDYPVDPGRENLRSPYKEDVDEIYQFVKETTQKISENELFKEGLSVTVFNKEFKPMATHEEEAEEDSSPQAAMLSQMSRQILNSSMFEHGIEIEEDAELPAEEVAQQVIRHTQNAGLTEAQSSIAAASIEALHREKDKKVDIKEEVDKIVEGLKTPMAITVQKGFASKDLADDPALTANLTILWQSVLRKINEAVKHRLPAWRSKEFVPGLVYSDECLALYSPPKELPYSVISINPLAVAAIVEPARFEKQIIGAKDSGAFEDAFDETVKDETPTNKLSSFLFHEAIHELTHLYFPDSWEYDEFHSNISKMEIICHFMQKEVRDEVKRYVGGLKKDCQKLITKIKRDLRGRGRLQ